MNLVSLHINKMPLGYSLTAFLYSQLKQIIMNSKAKVQEIWKTIKDYPNYEVSNLGRVKSLERKAWMVRNNCYRIFKEKILKGYPNGRGYLTVDIFNSQRKSITIHKAVALMFLNHKPDGTNKIVVDHINNIKTDNRLKNLQLITNRENSTKDRINGTSKYVGVNWYPKYNKWRSRIYINGKQKHLGYFINEIEASNAYKEKLLKYNG